MKARTSRNAPSKKPVKIYRWKKRRHGKGHRRVPTGKVATPRSRLNKLRGGGYVTVAYAAPANQPKPTTSKGKPVELSSLKPALNYWNDCPLCHSPDNEKAVITQVTTDHGTRKVATCVKCKQQFLAYHQ